MFKISCIDILSLCTNLLNYWKCGVLTKLSNRCTGRGGGGGIGCGPPPPPFSLFFLLFTTEVGLVGGRYPSPHNVNVAQKNPKCVRVPPHSATIFRPGAASQHLHSRPSLFTNPGSATGGGGGGWLRWAWCLDIVSPKAMPNNDVCMSRVGELARIFVCI